MKILVTGGRKYTDRNYIRAVLDNHPISYIVFGDATGADSFAKEWAIDNSIPYKEFKANWKKFGLAGGPLRNTEMLDYMIYDYLIAFPGGKGTNNMMKQARAKGLAVLEMKNEDSYF